MAKYEKEAKNIVTSENRDDFIAEKLGLNKPKKEEMPEEEEKPQAKFVYVVEFKDEDGKLKNSSKQFKELAEAQAHASKGNKMNKTGGSYTVKKIGIK